MGYVQPLLRFFSLETGSHVWPSVNRIQTSTILNSATIPAPGWILHLVSHGWPRKLPPPHSVLHSSTKLRIKINLNTLEIKLGFHHRRIAPEESPKARRHKHTFHSEKPRGSPWPCTGLSVHSALLQDPFVVNYNTRHSAMEMIMILSLFCAWKLNLSARSDEINVFISTL